MTLTLVFHLLGSLTGPKLSLEIYHSCVKLRVHFCESFSKYLQRFFLCVLAKTQFVQNAKTQFENTKTQFENAKTQFEN